MLLVLVPLFLKDACPDPEAVYCPAAKLNREVVEHEPKPVAGPAKAAECLVLPAREPAVTAGHVL